MSETEANGWTDNGIHVGGTTFGDMQVLEDIMHAYSRRLSDGTYIVVEHVLGVEMREDSDEPRYYVNECTHITRCTNPKDPGGSEISSGTEYGEGSPYLYSTPDLAYQEARRLAAMDIRSTLYVPTT